MYPTATSGYWAKLGIMWDIDIHDVVNSFVRM